MRSLDFLALALVAVVSPALGQQSPYVEYQGRPIKALSAELVVAYLAGDGMGFALPAELNGYLGPRHVLQLADSLSLDATQHAEVAAIFDRMRELITQYIIAVVPILLGSGIPLFANHSSQERLRLVEAAAYLERQQVAQRAESPASDWQSR